MLPPSNTYYALSITNYDDKNLKFCDIIFFKMSVNLGDLTIIGFIYFKVLFKIWNSNFVLGHIIINTLVLFCKLYLDSRITNITK